MEPLAAGWRNFVPAKDYSGASLFWVKMEHPLSRRDHLSFLEAAAKRARRTTSGGSYNCRLENGTQMAQVSGIIVGFCICIINGEWPNGLARNSRRTNAKVYESSPIGRAQLRVRLQVGGNARPLF